MSCASTGSLQMVRCIKRVYFNLFIKRMPKANVSPPPTTNSTQWATIIPVVCIGIVGVAVAFYLFYRVKHNEERIKAVMGLEHDIQNIQNQAITENDAATIFNALSDRRRDEGTGRSAKRRIRRPSGGAVNDPTPMQNKPPAATSVPVRSAHRDAPGFDFIGSDAFDIMSVMHVMAEEMDSTPSRVQFMGGGMHPFVQDDTESRIDVVESDDEDEGMDEDVGIDVQDCAQKKKEESNDEKVTPDDQHEDGDERECEVQTEGHAEEN